MGGEGGLGGGGGVCGEEGAVAKMNYPHHHHHYKHRHYHHDHHHFNSTIDSHYETLKEDVVRSSGGLRTREGGWEGKGVHRNT